MEISPRLFSSLPHSLPRAIAAFHACATPSDAHGVYFAQPLIGPISDRTNRYKGDPANSGGDKERAEAWAFAMAILPLIHQCDPGVASTVITNMKVGAENPMVDGWAAVKSAVESTYQCLGITCDDIGGLVNAYAADGTVDSYLFGECVDELISASAATHSGMHRLVFVAGLVSAMATWLMMA